MSDTTNGTVNADVQPETEKLPTLAFSVTPHLRTILDSFQYAITDNSVQSVVGETVTNLHMVQADGTTMTPVSFKRLLPNDKGVTPKAESFNGTLADSNALKLHLYVEANSANPVNFPPIDFLSDDELSIARLVPSEKKVESTEKNLKKILDAVNGGKKLTAEQSALVLALAAKLQ